MDNTRYPMNNSSFNDEEIWSFCLSGGAQNIVDLFLFFIISIVAVCGNIVVFICYARFRKLRTVTNVFIISLSASDLLVALISVPLSFRVFVCKQGTILDDKTVERFIYFACDMLPSILSIYSLALVAIDRAIAISRPFFHQENVTRKSAWISVAVMWIVMMLFAVVRLFPNTDQNYRDYTLSLIFVAYAIPVTVMILSYTVMGVVAQKHATELNELDRTMTRIRRSDQHSLLNKSSPPPHANDNGFDTVVVSNNEQKTSAGWVKKIRQRIASTPSLTGSVMVRARLLRRELKAALTLSLILSCFIISWTPFIALNIEYVRCGSRCNISVTLIKYFKILHYASSALNPILYILLNKRWRSSFKRVICCVSKQKYNQSISEYTHTDPNGW